jgi:hypothetical protein
MCHLEIQLGKEGMKNAQFNSEVGATSSCTLRLLLNSIAEEDNRLKHCIQGDAWFGSICTANEVGLHGHEGIFKSNNITAFSPRISSKMPLRMLPEVFTLC